MNTKNTDNPADLPRIGISTGRAGVPVSEGELASYYLGRAYVRAVARAGGLPLILPSVDEDVQGLVTSALDHLDGLLLPGGCDLSPQLYGGPKEAARDADPVRDSFELALLGGATERGLPVLGICRGMELINVAYGGTLRSEVSHPVATEVDVSELGSVQVHTVDVRVGTLAHEVFGRTEVEATCVHHQAPDVIGAGLVASILAGDGSVEAVESRERNLLGVIWHPELGLDRAPTHQLVYDWLVGCAGESRAAS